MPGTPKVGYMGPVPGGFRCGNCVHYCREKVGSGCNDKEVKAELGAGKNGLVAVDENGCCNEFKPDEKNKDGFGAVGLMASVMKKKKK